jgi:CBS domain-containing protein
MLVREAMTHNVVTVTPETTVNAALRMLDGHQITSMPVVSEEKLVGIVSEADLLRDAVPPDARARLVPNEMPTHPPVRTVEDVMTANVLAVREADDVSRAVEVLTNTAIKALPVLAGSSVVGMLSRRDVVHLLARTDQRIEGEIDELFRLDGVDWAVQVEEGQATITGPDGDRERRLATALASTVPGVVAVKVA